MILEVNVARVRWETVLIRAKSSKERRGEVEDRRGETAQHRDQ